MNNDTQGKRLPSWLRKKQGPSRELHSVKSRLRSLGLHTVCEEARCPNMGECFARGTATFLIMGGICTRRCGFCAVKSGAPSPIDPLEPQRVAEQVGEMGIRHAVITSVTRDDLPDGGAYHFAETVLAIRRINPTVSVELLTPDFLGCSSAIETVCSSKPEVFNHNVETVSRLTPSVRSNASYSRSLQVLAEARGFLSGGHVKSGIMLGLGEEEGEVVQTMEDIKKAGCDIITIGQYLPPSRKAIPLVDYIAPEKFREYEKIGLRIGFNYVFSGPLVRSSYLADKVMV